MSPNRLLDTFPAPDNHIHTLYDNLENSMVKYADVSCDNRDFLLDI
jgi:hypothetical protein